MFFPISESHISPIYLSVVGFLIGVLGGFFGVGGSFIAGPALRAVGLHWNFAVGTDLAHIVGKSVVAAKRHRALGNVDLRLGFIMAGGTIAGAEVGAQLIEMLKRTGHVDLVVSLVSIVVYFKHLDLYDLGELERLAVKIARSNVGEGRSLGFQHVTRSIQRLKMAAHGRVAHFRREGDFALGDSRSSPSSAACSAVSSAAAPATSGCLRWFIFLGIPTHLAVGTDLFEIIISASYGTFSHAVKGNVDILIALVMHTGAAIGAQIGAISTQYFAGPKIRLAFVPLPLIGAAIVIYTLMTGHKL